MVLWRIYYDNGSTFDNTNGEPQDAPGHGVVAIVENDDDHGRIVLNGWNWYYFDGEVWWGADVHGLLDRLCASLPIFGVKQGRMVPRNIWHDTMDRAVTDKDFKPKSAVHEKERPFQKVGW